MFPLLLEAGERFLGYRGDFYRSDVGSLEAYRAAQSDVLSGKVRVRIPGKRLGESMWVDADAHLHQTVTVEGPLVIGCDAVIGRGVILSGSVTIGPGCWVHPGAILKSTVMLSGSHIGSGAYLQGCILGPSYDVRPGECIRGGALSCTHR